ncbi:zinc finger and BTB domain-containing protein 16 [Platysternon megacephalum]|uniref:Zinc finger and BTB domain-containing protein 16 n=1 Tax=Platysternon megacephalum TaxID=55544 RepID=A0A4D9DV40_9SAUR|nr:zinc finger and BTB domain-containing protein 16 [Platysternon megacephalum]
MGCPTPMRGFQPPVPAPGAEGKAAVSTGEFPRPGPSDPEMLGPEGAIVPPLQPAAYQRDTPEQPGPPIPTHLGGCAPQPRDIYSHIYKHLTYVSTGGSGVSGPTGQAQSNRHWSNALTDPRAGVSACL